ncbi:2-aminoethylphosphonate--pyruvate transaminase [Candidatus Lokiarchaeum ossiferum]|uniref:2-aminoethylphosphonate--pyruvate transaminase n=1 Tax=Candidatus Lokiarchaeum ossiferum TaxID=2951803 RepID=A0ABY6HQH5_9ARCH|nr:2-aminoethylphosphonate--pyruvate transaminase [Candidatus Lokiarchaeum sp. B-35]
MPNKHLNPEGIDYKLFTPGPVEVPEWILNEMGKANDTHRSLAYREMHQSIRTNMQKLLSTKNEILIWANSGSGIMEACVRNLVKDDEYALFFTCGAFGDRWASMAKSNGKKADVIKVEWGLGVSPELVKETLDKADKKYSVVFITFNETSTGVLNPLDKIGPIVRDYGALLCVDTVSGMAGTLIKMDDWGIDVALASVQKCFALPPGIAVSAISDRAFEKAKTVENRGFYLDFLSLQKKGKNDEHPITPPIPQIRALKVDLEHIIERGVEQYAKDHSERTQLIRDWAVKEGFEIYSPEGYHSQTVVAIKNNENGPFKGDPALVAKFVDAMFERGFKIVNGYGKQLKGRNFRIAPMGWVTTEETQQMLDAATLAVQDALK